MSLRHSYTLIAPIYDALIARATRQARRSSLTALPENPGLVLLSGIGTGLDLPWLPAHHRYVGLDLTAAMLHRALPPAARLNFTATQGDAQRLPYADACFDAVVLHLILAVVPDPAACLAEATRVLKPGGRLLIFDKFISPDQPAPLRRLLNPLARRIATRLDVVFEPLLAACPQLELESDRAALARGWFRLIRLRRKPN